MLPARKLTLGNALNVYRRRRDWDAAFELIVTHALDNELEYLLRESIDELLDAADIATLTTLLAHAERASIETATVRLAQAELACRDGRGVLAMMIANAVLAAEDVDVDCAYRALSIAGRAAYLTGWPSQGLAHYRRAESIASSAGRQRSAQMGAAMCATILEHAEAHDLIDSLATTAMPDDRVDRVLLTDRIVFHGLRFGFDQPLGRSPPGRGACSRRI